MKKMIVLFMILGVCLCANHSRAEERVDYIRISISQCKLWAFKQNGTSLEVFREYQVCTTKEKIVKQRKCPMGIGRITTIVIKPSWSPTDYTRWYLATHYRIFLPEGIIPYGHPLNYMGEFKIDLSHSVPGKGTVFRIHGIMSKTINSIGKRESGGCTRMRNVEGLELCNMVSVGTPVEIVY